MIILLIKEVPEFGPPFTLLPVEEEKGLELRLKGLGYLATPSIRERYYNEIRTRYLL